METGQKYWRSLNELHGSPEFERWLHREFQEGASELPAGASRRNWLKLMAASIGLAGATACRKPVEHVMPHARGVEDYIPGKPYFYSTAMSMAGVGSGLLVEVNDGRPTKVEGNPLHPFSLGAANGFQQASILGLYDPDRLRTVLRDRAESSWEDFISAARAELSGGGGQGANVRFLSERIASPSLLAVREAALRKYPSAKWVEYEPIAYDNDLAGAQLAFGQPALPVYHFDKAEVILALDSDFLGCDAHTPLPAKQFSSKRRVASEQDEMNRLYSIEAMFTVTGAMADHRLRARSSDIRALAAQLGKQMGVLGSGLNVLPTNDAAQNKFLAAVGKDLQKNKGKSLVIAGDRQPAEVHALAYAMNQALGNVGETITFAKPPQATFRPQLESLQELAREMGGGQVQTLVMLGGNPVFNAPADLNFGDALKKVKTTIHLTREPNETSTIVNWALPEAHFMEAWGDVQSPDGTVAVQQPLIQPLFNGRTPAEVVAQLTGYPDQRAYDIVRNLWMGKAAKGEGEKLWRKAIHDGVMPGGQFAAITGAPDAGRISAAFAEKPVAQGIEVVFAPSSQVYDGRFANNGWLQEAPDPMTKLVWDNAALMSAKTAKQLGVEKSSIISIERNGRKIEVPVMEQPGHADNSITLAVGHGRAVCGRIGKDAGSNVYPVRTTDGFAMLTGATITKTGRYIEPPLATTQEHHSMEGRDIVREASLEEYKNPKEFAEKFGETEPLFSLFQEHDYSQGNQWGMAIDLNTCIGCNACVIACQAENNIPIVGKEQVLKGREMHWIRMDRYYTKTEEDPQAVMQVMLCQQCENAPCEAVCPVAATAHSPEGLNDMAYNRCVGTRYCSNNCPYKVRRFNFFNWHENKEEIEKLSFNPDVTVRMRGVMEKCNYCVQRIQEAKITAKAENRRPIRDGEIQTACQQTCPTDSIVFGNINDPNSRVVHLKKQHRDYAVLHDLNVKPRTTYLTKLRNLNPELA